MSRAPTDRPPREATATGPAATWRGLFLIILAIGAFVPALWGDFVFDDRGIIVDNPAVHEESPVPALVSRYWPDSPHAGLYRPVTTITFWSDTRLFGPRPVAHHAGNLLLHACVTLLLWLLLHRWFPHRQATAWMTAAIFAVHPLHAEAVAGIVGRAELLAAFWSLLSLVLVERATRSPAPLRGLALSALTFALAALSKESAVGLWGFTVYLGWVHYPFVAPRALSSDEDAPGAGHRYAQIWRRTALLWAVSLCFVLLLRLRVLGGLIALDEVNPMDNALVPLPAIERIFNALGILWIPLGQIFVPWKLSADYSHAAIVPGFGWVIGGVALALGLVALAAFTWKQRNVAALWGLAFLGCTGILTANVFFAIGTIYGERLAYLPMAGVVWLFLILAGDRVPARLRRPALALVFVWGVLLLARAADRSFDWRTNLTLFESATQTVPRSAKAWANYGSALVTAGSLDPAIQAARRALAIAPDYPPAHRILGSALNQSNRPDEALPHLRRAAQSAGRWRLEGTLDLGNAFLLLENGAAAESAFTAALALAKDTDASPWVGLASAYAQQSRWPESRTAWQNAVMRDSSDARFRSRWAYALWQAGHADSAETLYRKQASGATATADAKNDLAWFLIREQRAPDEAMPLALAAFTEAPGENTADTVMEGWLTFEGCESALAWWNGLSQEQRASLGTVKTKLASRCAEEIEAEPETEGTPQ